MKNIYNLWSANTFPKYVKTWMYLTHCHYCPHIEISQLICTANQLAGFYMSATLAFNELKLTNWLPEHSSFSFSLLYCQLRLILNISICVFIVNFWDMEHSVEDFCEFSGKILLRKVSLVKRLFQKVTVNAACIFFSKNNFVRALRLRFSRKYVYVKYKPRLSKKLRH